MTLEELGNLFQDAVNALVRIAEALEQLLDHVEIKDDDERP